MSPSTEIANTDLIVLAMAVAGAGDNFVDVEVVAEEAYRLSPQRFGWRTQPYPSDKTVVQAIADLEGKHTRDRLTRRGVRDQADRVATRKLTAEGREVARRVAERIAGREFASFASAVAHFAVSNETEGPAQTPAERRRVQADLVELRRQLAYQKWADEGDLKTVEQWQLLDALECLPDTPIETVQAQVDRLERDAERWDDNDVLAFLASVRNELGLS